MRFSLLTAVVAAFAGLTSAYTTPVGAVPSGNPTKTPALNQILPVGRPFSITWTPTTTGTITINLLRGPSDNVVYLATIVDKIPNTGSYLWTPSTALTGDVTHYGIELIDDATGAYQYTPQFGISNTGVMGSTTPPGFTASSTGSVGSPSASASSHAAGTTYTTVIDGHTTTVCPESQSATISSLSVMTTAVVTTKTTQHVLSTSYARNSSSVAPTASASAPASVLPVATTPVAPTVPAATATTTSIVTSAAGRISANLVAALAGLGAIALFL